MNAKQWTILFVAVALFALSELVPPWLYRCESGLLYPAGYSFVTKPPPIKDICPRSVPIPPLPTVVSNPTRLNAQRAAIILFAVGFLLLMKNGRTKLGVVAASLVICAGVVGLLYFLFVIWAGL
jgi:hypothetical protein